MGLFDKIKEAGQAALSKAKEIKDKRINQITATIDSVKKKIEEKAAAEKAASEAAEKAFQEFSNTVVSSLHSNFSGTSLFANLEKNKLVSFTKEFSDKIILPANSVNQATIFAYPYIDEKKKKKLTALYKNFDASSTVLITSEDADGLAWALTTSHLYFAKKPPKSVKADAWCTVLPLTDISSLEITKKENQYVILCNSIEILFFAEEKFNDDAVALTEYFRCLKEKDYAISDEEVDKLIQQKIGEKIYAQVKNHMVYDDELMIFFAWGLDSLTAKDYVVCTNKQVIIMDREFMGATANVKQLYYEDITSMQTVQNSQSDDLVGALLDSAVTAMTKTCDLEIVVAGAKHTINTLFKSEAERVIAVYHEMRKKLKQAAATPQVIVQQQAAQPDVLAQLEKLASLKAAGILNEEEFNAKKAELLSKL